MFGKKSLIEKVRKVQASPGPRGFGDRMLLAGYYRYQKLKQSLKNTDSEQASKVYLRTRALKRNLEGKRLKFINVDQASMWTLEWLQTFPQRYDLIVGVPRSGMLIASLVALKLGKALTTPDLFAQGKFWHSVKVKDKPVLDNVDHLLLIDDSMDTGRAMARAVDTIREANPDVRITRACLIIREESKESVDLYHKIIKPPRTFEWNILHRKIASRWGHGRLAVDLDGVLCANPPEGADADEQRYVDWLANANPYLIPSFKVDAIVTCRLEKYRQQTEDWLRKHDVKYEQLHMWDLPSKSDRKGRFVSHKVSVLLDIKPDMFWESNWDQSQAIWRATRIPTLCTDQMTLLS